MASVFMMNKTILTVSNSGLLPQQPSLIPSNRMSRVTFTSTSRNMAVKATQKDQEVDQVGDKYKELKHNAEDTAKDIQSKANEGAQQVSDALQEAKDKALEDTVAAKKGASEGGGDAAKAFESAGEQAKDGIQGAWDGAKDAAQKLKDA